jgi:hypothetical protein
MKDRSVNSYDLTEAQKILTALTPATGMASREKSISGSSPEYLRLSKEFLPQKMSRTDVQSLEGSKDSAAVSESVQPQKFISWESCIAWCMSTLRAEAAFVVDSQGFIIASRGRVPSHGFEGTGAELVCSVEQLERVEPDAGKLLWVDLDYDKRRVAAFVTPAENSDFFVLGFIAPDPGYHSLKQIVTRQIIENLPHLD